MAEPQFTRGTGGDPNNPPEPQGQATAVNDLVPSQQVAQGLIPGVSGRPAPPVPQPQADTETRKWLFRPTERPNGALTPPPDLMDWLPYLQDIAQEPDAAPAVRALYDVITQQLTGQ